MNNGQLTLHDEGRCGGDPLVCEYCRQMKCDLDDMAAYWEKQTMPKVFQVPAHLTRISYTADGGLSLGFHTNELTAAEKVMASEYHNQFGYLLFRNNQFSDSDIPEDDAPQEGKSPSQRLRAAIYILWKQKGSKADFEVFYRRTIEKIMDRIKKELD